jgi:hypothetical protein
MSKLLSLEWNSIPVIPNGALKVSQQNRGRGLEDLLSNNSLYVQWWISCVYREREHYASYTLINPNQATWHDK